MPPIVPFDWTASFLSSSSEDRTAILQRLLDAELDASTLSEFKSSQSYKLFCEFIRDQMARIQENMFQIVEADIGILSSSEKRDAVFNCACALKSYRDLLAFIDNTIEFGKVASTQAQTLNSINVPK